MESLTLTLDEMMEIGNYWEGGENKRIYFEDEAKYKMMGLEVEFYGSGSPKKVYLDGEKISNSKGFTLLLKKCYYDLNAEKLIIE